MNQGATTRFQAKLGLLLLSSLLIWGCGSEDKEKSKDATLTSDSGTMTQNDSGSVQPRSDSGVTPAVDMAPLPETCPCPLDSYCDLSTNSCVVGCKSNDHCNQGKYCDTADELCKVGCRTKADCQNDDNPCTDLVCDNGSCLQQPNNAGCPDDGNSCTADVCSGGSCTHPAANNGKLCGDTKDCSDFRCQNGACKESFFKEGESCPDDGDSCTADTCNGQGTCTHDTVPDGTECPNTWGGWDAKCFGGQCTPKLYQCCGYDSFTSWLVESQKYEDWTGTTGCGCNGSTMKWTGYASGYLLDHSWYCDACEAPSGSWCQSCYKMP